MRGMVSNEKNGLDCGEWYRPRGMVSTEKGGFE